MRVIALRIKRELFSSSIIEFLLLVLCGEKKILVMCAEYGVQAMVLRVQS